MQGRCRSCRNADAALVVVATTTSCTGCGRDFHATTEFFTDDSGVFFYCSEICLRRCASPNMRAVALRGGLIRQAFIQGWCGPCLESLRQLHELRKAGHAV